MTPFLFGCFVSLFGRFLSRRGLLLGMSPPLAARCGFPGRGASSLLASCEQLWIFDVDTTIDPMVGRAWGLGCSHGRTLERENLLDPSFFQLGGHQSRR